MVSFQGQLSLHGQLPIWKRRCTARNLCHITLWLSHFLCSLLIRTSTYSPFMLPHDLVWPDTLGVSSSCYQTQVWMLATQKPVIWEASVSRKESRFNQKIRQSGEKVDSCRETDSKGSAQPWQLWKGKLGVVGRKSLSESLRQEVGFCITLHCVRLADPLFRCYLAPWSACRIAKGGCWK